MKKLTIGIDLGDKKHTFFTINSEGQVLDQFSLKNTHKDLSTLFTKYPGYSLEVIMETGTHSPWISRFLEERGARVIVANSRQLALITKNMSKNDRCDAELLARLGRVDKKLLKPIRHRSLQSQQDQVLLKCREALVKSRSQLVNCCRGLVKSFGYRLPKCSSSSFHKQALSQLPDELRSGLSDILGQISNLTASIKRLDGQIEEISRTAYPETQVLRQVAGVGPLTALTYILTLDRPDRLSKNRQAGPYLGLVPKQRQSGDQDPQLRITKQGNMTLRALLVSCSQYILGPFGPDCDLRRYGEKIAAQGGRIAKKRAVVAVARKLAVLLHYLWKTGDTYDPFYQLKKRERRGQAA